jgi:hypothetical protein
LEGKTLKKENLLFVFLAFITVICIMAIGVSIALRSFSFALLSILGVLIAMGIGFYLKKRLRESQEI